MNYIIMLLIAAVIFVLGHPDLKDLIRIILPSDPAETYNIVAMATKGPEPIRPTERGEVGVFPWGPEHLSMPM